MKAADKITQAEALVNVMRELGELGLNKGSAGNASCRIDAKSYQVTPSGVPPANLSVSTIVEMAFNQRALPQKPAPSSEWRMHHDIYLARPEVNAIIHTHSTYATALSCMGEGIPAFHYMIAVAGGSTIRCAPYATFGTQALSDAAVEALRDRTACLLANHGVITVGRDLGAAVALAGEVEELARQYCVARSVGTPEILSREEMSYVLKKFETYGQQSE